jgi:transposase
MILARLHAQGLGQRWEPEAAMRREMRALVERRDLYADVLARHWGRLEALLARHWPELGRRVDVHRKAPLHLLEIFGSPAGVAAQVEEATQLLRRRSCGRMSLARATEVVESAATTLGVPMSAGQVALLHALVREILRLQSELEVVDAEAREMCGRDDAVRAMSGVMGHVSAVVVVAMMGDPTGYASAHAFEKGCGLNLREKSSGTKQGAMHVTKRGPGSVRKYLFMAALRLIARDEIVRAWYVRRRAFRGGQKVKAVVAVMRKLCRALWHVARGAAFDSRKLFDVRRLVPSSTTGDVVARPSLPEEVTM